MKTQPKTKNIARKTKKSAKFISGKVRLVNVKTPGLRHLRLVEHKHTGKLIHHHTLHVALVILLAVIDFFLYISQGFVSAIQQVVGVIVPGPALTVGATIVAPVDGLELVDTKTVEVSGTCADNPFVSVFDNQ